MSEPKTVEAVGHARVDMQRLWQRAIEQNKNHVRASLAKIHLVRKDEHGNVIEEKTVSYGDNG